MTEFVILETSPSSKSFLENIEFQKFSFAKQIENKNEFKLYVVFPFSSLPDGMNLNEASNLIKELIAEHFIESDITEELKERVAKEYETKHNDGINFPDSLFNLKKKSEQYEKVNFYGATFDSLEISKKFVEKFPLYYDNSKIWWQWDKKKKKWGIVDDVDILNLIAGGTDLLGITKSGKRSELLESLKMVARTQKPKEAPKEWIQFKDMIFDTKKQIKILPTKEYFLVNPIDWEIGDSEDTPKMDKLFEEWVGKDYVNTLYEMIAYSLIPDVPIHRGFILVGSGMNGKSKFLELLNNFIGKENSCTTDLDLILVSRFELFKLYKKLICIMGETNDNELTNSSRLKQITDGSIIGFEKKGKDGFDAQVYSKLFIATNNLPGSKDKSNGFYRRWLIVDFPNQFTEKKDVLAEIPKEEYSNLAKKCLRILKELLDKREFTNEGSIEERKQRYEDRSNPLQKFLAEETEQSFDGHIFKFEFKDKFQSWLKVNKYRIMTETEIGKKMNDLFEVKQVKNTENKLWRAYVGISWKSQGSQGSHTSSTQNTYIETKCEMGVNPVKAVIEETILTLSELIKQKGTDNLLFIEEILKYGFSEEEIERAKQKGEVFEPRKGFLGVL